MTDDDSHRSEHAPAADMPISVPDGGTAHRREILAGSRLEESFPDWRERIRHGERLDARSAETVAPERVLRDPLASRLSYDLYSHQAEALELLAAGENVVVTTSTSSGKTLIYQLQIARNHLESDAATALCLFPTKALTNDQEQALNDRLRGELALDTHVGTYDGDTTDERKRTVRENANVILTNPAGLNVYLPRHNRDRGWHRFYSNLELVVIDEGHEYGGVMGTHVAWILRRLRRVLAHYGSDPQFVITTATIGNPAAHAGTLTGAEFDVVDEDGSPRGTRDIVLWEPPLDEAALEGYDDGGDDPMEGFERARRSSAREASSVTAHLAVNGVQTLQFTTARQGTEIGAKRTTEAARDHPRDRYVDVEPYHAGLGKRKRRAVENQLKSADLDAVISTNALELGIDIGSVDATVTDSYPGTKQSFWQQIGRAGRGTSDALSVLVGGTDAMDAYILDNPGYLFDDDTVEDAVVSIDNDRVFADHLLAAAAERPLTAEDASYLGGDDRFRDMVTMWQDAGLLERAGDLDAGGVTYAGDRRPQSRISLYGTTGTDYEVICDNGDIEHDPVATERAYRDYHVGALFLHAGQQYEVTEVDHSQPHPRIHVEEVTTTRYTQTLSSKQVRDLDVTDHTSVADGYDIYFGTGTVRITHGSYMVRDFRTGELVDGPLPTETPPLDLRTELLWVSLPEDHLETTIDALDAPLLQPTERARDDSRVPMEHARYTYAGGLHAAEHGIIQLAPLELMIDNHDIGGLSTPSHPHGTIPGPTWFVHDGIDGGIGFSKAIYEHVETLAARTREHIADCECGRRRGCPLCVMSEDCGNDNDPLDTATGRMILDDLLTASDTR
jgi:DEAD/DEAH box helicase domain-containing protein